MFSRRSILLGGLCAIAASGAKANDEVTRIARQFSSYRTMDGKFMQFDSDGRQSEGTFVLARPGQIRFDYGGTSSLRVIADGRSVAVANLKLGTWNLYPLSQTPLKLLLDDRLDLSSGLVQGVVEKSDTISVVLADKGMFGNSSIEVMFDRASGDLKQWTTTDPQGKETAVVVYDVRTGADVPRNSFRIPYGEIRTLR